MRRRGDRQRVKHTNQKYQLALSLRNRPAIEMKINSTRDRREKGVATALLLPSSFSNSSSSSRTFFLLTLALFFTLPVHHLEK